MNFEFLMLDFVMSLLFEAILIGIAAVYGIEFLSMISLSFSTLEKSRPTAFAK